MARLYKIGVQDRKNVGNSIDNGVKWLYICVVLMYQHKGVSPEPFEQPPIKFGKSATTVKQDY